MDISDFLFAVFVVSEVVAICITIAGFVRVVGRFEEELKYPPTCCHDFLDWRSTRLKYLVEVAVQGSPWWRVYLLFPKY